MLRRVLSLGFLLSIIVALVTALAVPSATAVTRVPGSPNVADDRGSTAMFEALPDGRSFVATVDPGLRLREARLVITAYTRSGQKLWTVDQRGGLRRGITLGQYNKDAQRHRAGTIMQACLTFVGYGPGNHRACATNAV